MFVLELIAYFRVAMINCNYWGPSRVIHNIMNVGQLCLRTVQCDVGSLDPNTVSLRMMDLRTVDDCPEDSVSHILYLLI